MNKFKFLLTTVIQFFFLVACSLLNNLEFGTISAPSQSKPLPPLAVEINIEQEPIIGKDLSLTLLFTPERDVDRAVGQIETTGVVELLIEPSLSWNDLLANQEIGTQASFRVDDFGEGEIKWTVRALTKTGEIQYGRSKTLYVLVTEEGVLTGTDTPASLELKHLERQFQSGTITREEYDTSREKILSSGAVETN